MTHKEYLDRCKQRRYLIYKEVEKAKIEGRLLKQIAKEHEISYTRLYQIYAKTRKDIGND